MIKILMSTYNGQYYLKEQLDSIFAQTYQDFEIYVRDDGSTDDTLTILKQYEYEKKIKLIQGENIGFTQSFFNLLENCGVADYYAFSDQDDIWLPEKLEHAMVKLSVKNQNIPQLYYSNYDLHDKNLNFLSSNRLNLRPTFQNILIQVPANGFTYVFNHALIQAILGKIPQHSIGHDWWLCFVCKVLGEFETEDIVMVKWRRNEDSVTIKSSSFFSKFRRRVEVIINEDYFDQARLQLKEFLKLYGEYMNDEQKRLSLLFSTNKNRFSEKIEKLFFKQRYCFQFIDEVFFRLFILIGLL